ncbi:hypothetical protein GCM10023186_16200 [Hymenobacter koreensis]|uniref:Uncharacterized protein n=1 Tax=Hymenobacter koreensis TaxID=1084523 RepID=A0ABP8IXX4_9BACT
MFTSGQSSLYVAESGAAVLAGAATRPFVAYLPGPKASQDRRSYYTPAAAAAIELKVENYTIGESDCPFLFGAPNMRY